MHFLRLIIFVSFIFPNTITKANPQSSSNRISHEQLLKELVYEFQSIKNKKELLAHLKNTLSSDNFIFLNEKLSPIQAIPLPKIKYVQTGIIQINVKNNIIQVNFSKWEQRTITLNNRKTILIGDSQSTYEEVEKYILDMQHPNQNFTNLFIPKTQAVFPFIPVAIAIVSSATITALVTEYFFSECTEIDCLKLKEKREQDAALNKIEEIQNLSEPSSKKFSSSFKQCIKLATNPNSSSHRELMYRDCIIRWKNSLDVDTCSRSANEFISSNLRDSAHWFCLTRVARPYPKECDRYANKFYTTAATNHVKSYCAALKEAPSSPSTNMEDIRLRNDQYFFSNYPEWLTTPQDATLPQAPNSTQ